MCLSRWLSLSIAVIYILFFTLSFAFSGDSFETSLEDLVEGALGLAFWLVLSVGCIWFGEELGEGLLGAQLGLVSSKSPGWAVQLMGWLLLLLPAALFLWHLFGAEK